MTPTANVEAELYLVSINFTSNYDLTGSYFHVEVPQVLTADGGTYTDLIVLRDDNNQLMMQVNSNTLHLVKIVGGVNSDVATVTYNATTHRWWRIRESGGTIYYDASTNGISWSNLASVANPFNIKSVYPKLDAYSASVASPGVAYFDNFNVVTAGSFFGKSNIISQSVKRASYF